MQIRSFALQIHQYRHHRQQSHQQKVESDAVKQIAGKLIRGDQVRIKPQQQYRYPKYEERQPYQRNGPRTLHGLPLS